MAIDWDALREEYEGDASDLKDIAGRFAVNPGTLRKRARREGWVRCAGSRGGVRDGPRRRPATDPATLVASLQRTTARLVRAAERRYAAGGAEPIEEKDLRTLTALAGMLAKVIALDPRSPRDDPSADASADLDFDDPRQRDALSECLERLAEKRAGGPPPGDDADGAAAARGVLAAVREGGPAAP